MSLGRTTPDEVEQAFGSPDERLADGALVYRNTIMRGPEGAGQSERDTTTFRFEGGVLAKICRARSDEG
jgi:hypothetical protein